MRFSRNPVLCLALWLSCGSLLAQGVDVSAKFAVTSQPHPATHKTVLRPALSGIVLWLTRVDDPTSAHAIALPRTGYRLVQKDKMFTPHLLVVPTGTSVDFPNLDPFFHNVFSLFNGKRFDLGLYEAGTHRAVRFDREGVSYIFCNIHPEMGAIVLALNSPYFALSDATGTVTVHGVPPGKYQVHVWGEQVLGLDAATERRVLEVTSEPASLGTIELMAGTPPQMGHKNKFGEDYPPSPTPAY